MAPIGLKREAPLKAGISTIICTGCLLASSVPAQTPVRLTVDATYRGYAIPSDFIGLGFETKSVVPNTYGVSGYFFGPGNRQLITLFQNIGIKNIRVGGGTVDASGTSEHCVTPTPTHTDIDNLFEFAKAANVKVIYSLRLLDLAACPNPNLASEDASIAQYVWSKYRSNLDSFSIGNEPDVRSFHSYPGQLIDPLIVEAKPGVPGSAYPSYFADWRHFASVILKSVPQAKLSGPDTAVSSTSSYTPNPSTGISWTEQFSKDLKAAGILSEALQHHYVWGTPNNTTTQEAIDDMLSSSWDNDTSVGTQPAHNGGTADFHPYPYLFRQNLAPLVSYGVPYRMTEANDCLHGVVGASDGYASALWALDYMHWWAAHHMAGVNFHNNPWIPTDTVVPDPNPCPPSGCANYRVTPKAYGMKAFDLGGHGYVEPVAISNPDKINLTAYAAGTAWNLYVTIINKTHATTKDSTDATVVIQIKGLQSASAAYMVLTDGDPGNASRMTATLGGSTIANDARWLGRWTPLGRVIDGRVTLTVQSTTAVVVKIQAAGSYSGPIQINQNGALEIFGIELNGHIGRIAQDFARASNDVGSTRWTELGGEIMFSGSPSVATNEDNTLEVFAPDAAGHVYHNKQRTPGGEWSGWSQLGGDGITHLVAAANADGSLSVFGSGPNGDVWTNTESAPGVGWSGWRDLSGQSIQPGFVVAQGLDGRLDVFGVDHSGNVFSDEQTEYGSWSGWHPLAGNIGPRLAVGRDLDGRLELFGIGPDGRMMHNMQRGAGGEWTGWGSLGTAKIDSDFAVGQYSDGRLALFGVGTHAAPAVWSISQEAPGGSYGDWYSLGGSQISQLVVANDISGRVRLFGIGKDKSLWSIRETTVSHGWPGWTRIADNLLNFYPDRALILPAHSGAEGETAIRMLR